MCDKCRGLFLSDDWRALHPAWESRKDAGADEEATAGLTAAGLSGNAVMAAAAGSTGSKSATTSKVRARLSERELIEKLGESRDREQSLLEELDAYKRALRFARNFIELEQHAHADAGRGQALASENAKLREAVKMYQDQLSKVTRENEKLSAVLQEIVTGPSGSGGGGRFSMSGLF